jgi:hypothetical protein
MAKPTLPSRRSPAKRREILDELLVGGRFGRDGKPEENLRIGRGGVPLSALKNFRETFWWRSGVACSDPAGTPPIIADPPLPEPVVPEGPSGSVTIRSSRDESSRLGSDNAATDRRVIIDMTDAPVGSPTSSLAIMRVAATLAPLTPDFPIPEASYDPEPSAEPELPPLKRDRLLSQIDSNNITWSPRRESAYYERHHIWWQALICLRKGLPYDAHQELHARIKGPLHRYLEAPPADGVDVGEPLLADVVFELLFDFIKRYDLRLSFDQWREIILSLQEVHATTIRLADPPSSPMPKAVHNPEPLVDPEVFDAWQDLWRGIADWVPLPMLPTWETRFKKALGLIPLLPADGGAYDHALPGELSLVMARLLVAGHEGRDFAVSEEELSDLLDQCQRLLAAVIRVREKRSRLVQIFLDGLRDEYIHTKMGLTEAAHAMGFDVNHQNNRFSRDGKPFARGTVEKAFEQAVKAYAAETKKPR